MIISMIDSPAFRRVSPSRRRAIAAAFARAFLDEFARAVLGTVNQNFRKRAFDYEVYP